MRVSTALNRMLDLPGAYVTSLTFTGDGIVVGVRRRFRRLRCPCGWSTAASYDRSKRRWRHLDLAGTRVWLEAEIRRLDCRSCGRVRTEQVPWARPGGRHTRDFEDVVTWLAQHTDKTAVSRLLRCAWETVDAIVTRVVVEAIDQARLEGLLRIGVDEISWRRGHHYLTVVADHDHDGRVVWAAEGRSAQTLTAFYDELGAEQAAMLEAVTMDLGRAYVAATSENAPNARICFDPFHVIAYATDAVDLVRRDQRRTGKLPISRAVASQLRWALLSGNDRLNPSQQQALGELRRAGHLLWRAWQLKEELRGLYQLDDPALAPAYLDWWLKRAARSRIPAMVLLGRTIRSHRDGILAAIELGLSNSRLEGLNSKIRLINHRGYGHHSAAAIIAMTYLCCGVVQVSLPWG